MKKALLANQSRRLASAVSVRGENPVFTNYRPVWSKIPDPLFGEDGKSLRMVKGTL